MYSFLRRALSWVPTFVVLAGLLGLGVWGAAHDWKPSAMLQWLFPKPMAEKKAPAEESDGNVRLASVEASDSAGIEVDAVRRQPPARFVEAHAVLAYDQTRYAQLSARAQGTAWSVLRQAGDRVKKGDVLALVSSPDASKARSEFLTAVVQHDVKEKSFGRVKGAAGSIPERQYFDAQLALREARVQLVNAQQALVNLGLPVKVEALKDLPDEVVARKVRVLGLPANLASDEDLPASLLPILSPFDGLIIRRELVEGEVTGPDKPAFVVADVRKLWVQMDVRQEDVVRLSLGQSVTFESSATGQQAPEGELKWISAEVDARTRTVKARAEVSNPDGNLRPATFGKARIAIARKGEAMSVPTGSLQWDGQARRVFVRRGAATYEPRFVLAGPSSGGWTELLDPRVLLGASSPGQGPSPLGVAGWLLAGEGVLVPVAPGEKVATTGSHVLKSEMLKSRIGGED